MIYFATCGVIGFILGFIALGNASIVARSILAVIGGLVLGALGYLNTPTLAWNFSEWATWLAIYAAGMSGLNLAFSSNRGVFHGLTGIAIAVLLWIWVICAPWFTSWAAFHYEEYRALIGDVTESQFTEDVSPVDLTRIRDVDQKLARIAGGKRLGEIPGLGSRTSLGKMNIQGINGEFVTLDQDGKEHTLSFHHELVWAAPLNPTGFFREWNTPGYVLVSALDVSRVWLVTAIKGEDGQFHELDLNYLIESYMDKDLERYLRNNGYLTKGITDYTFEIRDDGRPFWVVTTYEKTVGFEGEDATGVVVVDVQTGEITPYSIGDAPAWIDRIQPESFVDTQLDDWGTYNTGDWWNTTMFGRKEGMQATTPGMSLVYGVDGRSYFYTGMSSHGKESSTVGFVLVDTRTKKAHRYMIAGATETAAQTAAENEESVKAQNYSANTPILYNVGGIPTYYMTLKGGNGQVQARAFVSVENFNIVGVAKTAQDALRKYQIALSQSGGSLKVDDLVELTEITAVVKFVAAEPTGNSLLYYVILEGNEGQEFYAGSTVSPEFKYTQAGHTVSITYNKPQDPIGTVTSVLMSTFDNHAVDLPTGK